MLTSLKITSAEKAAFLVRYMKRILLGREARLENHVGFGAEINCTKCYSWKAYDGWKVDYCHEAQRLADRVESMKKRIKALTLVKTA